MAFHATISYQLSKGFVTVVTIHTYARFHIYLQRFRCELQQLMHTKC